MYIMIKVIIKNNMHNVWNAWNNTDHINNWYSGNEDWYTVKSINNLQVGKSFMYLMKSKKEDQYFEFEGTYTEVIEHKLICYSMVDKRKVEIEFQKIDNVVMITQKIEPDTKNPYESQATWWRAIILNFKKYAESK